jgi:hypothetical protein
MPHDVFISHSTDDKLVALALCNKLESAGVRCWIAPRDVGPGAEWGKSIVDAISECRIMLLVFSAKANESRHIHREIQTAFEKDLTVIPFRVENTQPTGTMEYYLGSVHWLDALTAPVESHMIAVVERVKALLPAVSILPPMESVPPIPPIAAAPDLGATLPEATKEPPRAVPPPYVAPLSVTTGPAAGIAPAMPSGPTPRKKRIRRILMGVVGLIAIGVGATQIASGMHLFSKKRVTKWREEEIGDRVSLPKYHCSLRVPKAWIRKNGEAGATMFSSPPDSAYPSNLIVNSEPFAGSLKEYKEATLKAIHAIDPAAEIIHHAQFKTEAGATAESVTFSRVVQGNSLLQELSFYDGAGASKIVVTMSTGGLLFFGVSACPWTLIVTGDKG